MLASVLFLDFKYRNFEERYKELIFLQVIYLIIIFDRTYQVNNYIK